MVELYIHCQIGSEGQWNVEDYLVSLTVRFCSTMSARKARLAKGMLPTKVL